MVTSILTVSEQSRRGPQWRTGQGHPGGRHPHMEAPHILLEKH